MELRVSITREVIAVNATLVILEITAKQVRDNFPRFACTIPLLNYISPNEFSVYAWVKEAFWKRPFPSSKNSYFQTYCLSSKPVSCENEFYLYENKKSFPYQWLCT